MSTKRILSSPYVKPEEKKPPPLWEWIKKLFRYRNLATGRFIGPEQMLKLRDTFMDLQGEAIKKLGRDYAAGKLSLSDWVLKSREMIKQTYIDQYILGHGGRNSMSQADWGRLGQMLRKQYGFLEHFALDLESGRYVDADGNILGDAIGSRLALYVNSSAQAYERGHVLGQGVPDLPAYPGDGSSECLCLTDPSSLILTSVGWKRLDEVQVGDLVFTHKLRWRPVLQTIVKPSQPYHHQVYVRAPNGKLVGATDNHLWWTAEGWLNANDIDSRGIPLCHLPALYGVEVDDDWQESQAVAQLRFGDLLPPGTAVYDLTVAEDHSFCVAGLFAHNSNCRCYWEIVHQPATWECYWREVGDKGTCPTCDYRGGAWNPLIIEKPFVIIAP